VLTREQMPDDNAKLAAIPVELPHGPEGVAPPSKIEPHLLEYLGREGLTPDGELRFLRTAVFERTLYWVWAFETGGEPALAVASTHNRQSGLSAQVNHWGLSPEQFVLTVHHGCL
jgi:hypothetical protein